MPRFLLVRCGKGTLVANPHTNARRFVGKPSPGPVWGPNEQPVDEVVQDEAALRKAHRGPDKFEILAECVADGLEAARAALQSAPAPAAPMKSKKGGE